MKTIQEIEAKIRRLVPRLMDLSFGCSIKIKKTLLVNGTIIDEYLCRKEWIMVSHNFRCEGELQTSEMRAIVVVLKDKNSLNNVIGLTLGTEVSLQYFIDNIEIIGHTIDLEAVLEALSCAREKCDKRIMFRKDFLIIASDNDYGRVEYFDDSPSVIWEYGEPFNKQSHEVHEFVANILFDGK